VSVLTHQELIAALAREEDRLVVTPILDPKQIGPASIDLRLGPDIIALQKSRVAGLDLTDGDSRSEIARYARTIHVGYHGKFVLHPGTLVLGATLEYLGVPKHLFCTVEGRSSLGRAGLIIATATSVQPGFRGCITLEIENLGPVPITLFPGLRIAQLVVFSGSPGRPYEGQFRCPTGPELGMIRSEPDVEFFSSDSPSS
jgi:dCTP deaminase